jgi:hypothetical protein
MEKPDVDEAFEWLIVMLSIVSAILSQYPEYFYTVTPMSSRPTSLKAAMSIVPPLVITIIIWLTGKLSRRRTVQALSRVIAWMITLGITWVNLNLFFQGIMWAAWRIIPNDLMITTGLLGFSLLCPAVTYFVVMPRYREVYPDLPFFRSRVQFLVVQVVIYILLFALIESTFFI